MHKKGNDPEKLAPEDRALLEESKKAYFIESPKWASVILYTMGIFVIVFLIWSNFAILDEVTVAQGKVIPSSQMQIVQNLEGGIVVAIYVKEGDEVEKGQVLMRLDDTKFIADYRQSLAKYLSLLANIARLSAEQNNRASVEYPDIVKTEGPELVAQQNQLFEQKRTQLNENLSNLEESYQLATQEYNISTPLVDQGLMSQLELIRLEREMNDIQGKISDAKETYASGVEEDYNKDQAELLQVAATLAALKDRMVRTTVLSPVKGIVNKINISTIGGVVQPGMDIMEIVPIGDTLLIEAKIRPKDIAFIHPDQQALVKFTAYDYSIYGGLEGVVEYISPDTITEQNVRNPAEEESYYKILVRTKTNHLIGKNGKPLRIIPGMQCTVDILTGKHSVLDYIMKPIFKAKENALRER